MYSTFAYSTHDELPAEAAALVDAGLDAANSAAAPLGEVRPLACVAKLESGEIVGGVIGRTWGQCCEVQQLWVQAEYRRQGIGHRLMQELHACAAARGCRTCYLETFSFQAPAFYQALGYATRLEISGYGPGIVKYTLVLEMT